MRILVTGGTGFVGAHVVRRLVNSGVSVDVLVQPASDRWRLADLAGSIQVRTADLCEPPGLAYAIEQAAPEAVAHLAAAVGHVRTTEELRYALEVSVLGSVALVDACAAAGVRRVVFAGSSTVYGHKDEPHCESDPVRPFMLRGVAKAAGWQACRQRAEAHGLEVVCLRLFNVYGPWEQPGRLIPTAVTAALWNRELSLPELGYVRDFVFAEDVAEVFLCAFDAPGIAGEIFNIGSGVETTLERAVELIEKAAGRTIRATADRYDPGPFAVRHWRADIGKAREHLGWAPQTALEAGLRRTVEWFMTERTGHYGS